MQVPQSLGQSIPRVTAMIAATAVATQLSTIIKYNPAHTTLPVLSRPFFVWAVGTEDKVSSTRFQRFQALATLKNACIYFTLQK